MLPGRLGLRFALEALFLVLLAVGAGLADLRPAVIVVVMAAAWVLVALVELTAERITASPLSYLLPERAGPEEKEPERVAWPMPEERTVVAPPERPAEPEPEEEAEPEPEPKPALVELEPEPEPEPLPALAEVEAEPVPVEREPEPQPTPEAAPELREETAASEEPAQEEELREDTLEQPVRRRLRPRLGRRKREEPPPPAPPPRHVRLLPRRPPPDEEPSRAAREVAELFGAGEPDEREEHRG